MRRSKKRLLAMLLAGILLIAGGCSLDVETLLTPPRAQGEQQAVQAALETYLKDAGLAAARYTLKYPSEGEHTSAFVLCDEEGKPTTTSGERAAFAVAFYSLATATEETHVNLLRREGEEWMSVGDSVGYGADIQQVAFGDLNGDGMGELLTGWSTYHSKDHRLAVFTMGEELLALSAERVYTQLYVGDITADGKDSLLLLHIGGANKVTATLENLRDGKLVSAASTRLDGYIQQFGGMTLCRLAQGVHGLYVDGVKSANSMVTELIYYKDGKLVTPFYNPLTNMTTATARATLLPSQDMDGDAQVDIPTVTPLAGYTPQTATHTTAQLTTWRTWDYAANKWIDRQHTIRNGADGYMVILNEATLQGVTTAYDAATRTLDIMQAADKRVWLRLWAGEETPPPTDIATEQVVLFSAREDGMDCTAWYDPSILDEEKVRYMVARLTSAKGE
ncbi:MAG: hypothetical protein IIW40_02700 [Clostridia bacterium]|nr:hypothetical protein [Clostridia bacterium]